MASDHPRTRRGKARREAPREASSTDTDSDDGSGLLKAVSVLVAIPVGWFVSVVAPMFVLAHLLPAELSITLIPGLNQQQTVWLAVAVTGLVTGTIFVRPRPFLAGWVVMGGVVAVAATFFVGWTTLLVVIEVLTLAYVALAVFAAIVSTADNGVLTALALHRWLS